jgi:putative flippase GtrA
MGQFSKRDLGISVLIGFLAGFLLLPILPNIGISLKLSAGFLVVFGVATLAGAGYLIACLIGKGLLAMIQFAKFGIVGGLNAMIDLGILNLLIHATAISSGIFYSVFKSLSFLAAVINSYFWNKYWTFKVSGNPQAGEFLKFLSVNIVGFGINVGTASFIVNAIGAPAGISGELWANIGAVIASLVALMWNFIGMKFIVFKK